MSEDLFDKLRQMQFKKPKTFDEMPDMMTAEGDDGIKKFDLNKFAQDALDGVRKDFEKRGDPVPEMKVIGVSVHVVMLNPGDAKRKDVAHAEMVAWHKDAGRPDDFGAPVMTLDSSNKCGCDKECNHAKSADPDEQPYQASKCDGIGYA